MYDEAIKKIIKDFGLFLYKHSNRYVGCCPIHEGADNPTAFNIDAKTGIWFCNTQKCHEHSGYYFDDFVRQLIISRSRQNECSDETLQRYLNDQEIDLEIIKQKQKNEEYTPKTSVEFDLDLDYFDEYDIGNCAFFINRGFSRDILKKHYVFTCPDPTKDLYHLCVVPIFNITKTKCVGITARMPYEECLVCGGYHNPQELCPDVRHNSFNPKWRHKPKGFAKGNHLYNIWNSWQYIKTWKDIIIVESPSNVWKLDQCGFPQTVGVLGSDLSDKQSGLIERLKPERIYALGDNDTAGYKLMESIEERFKNSGATINKIEINTNDISEMKDDDVKELMWKQIRR